MTAISGANPALDTWTELSGFQELRAAAREDGGKSALPAVAKQFEAIFTQMMLKSMRDANASIGSGLGDSEAGDTYRDLYDQQLSLTLANGGKGLGIADMLVRQLGGVGGQSGEGSAGHSRESGALNGRTSGHPGSANGRISLDPRFRGDDGAGAAWGNPGFRGDDGAAGRPVAARQGISAIANANLRALLRLGADGSSAAGGTTADTLPAADAGSGFGDMLSRLARGAASAAGAAARFLPGGDPVAFVRTLAPHAAVAAEQLGVSVRALLAQAALETGWGSHLPSRGDGTSSFNLFGIKAGGSWDGAKVTVPTLEYEGGVAVRRQDQFRAYGSPAASFADYARLLRDSPRYAQALGQGENVAGFARALVRGGYATDPAYAQKITAIANSPQMHAALAALKNPAAAPTPTP